MSKHSKKSLLWRIQGEDLPGTSYLFGTMHVKNQRVFDHLDNVYNTISHCDAFAAEFELDKIPDFSITDLFRLPDDLTLSQLIPAKKWDKLAKILLKTVGITLNHYNYFQPLFISNIIEEQILKKDMPVSLDEHLWHFASSNNKAMKGIETFEEQLEILKKISLEQQLKSLFSMMRNFSRFRQHLLKMADWYEEGEIVKLYKGTRSGARETRHILLFDRNHIMATRICGMIAHQTTFCAIGAAHLAGQKGVLNLLKNRGFQIEPLSL